MRLGELAVAIGVAIGDERGLLLLADRLPARPARGLHEWKRINVEPADQIIAESGDDRRERTFDALAK